MQPFAWYPRLSKGGTTGNFLKIQKVSQLTQNFVKIVKNHIFHQNNCFQLIETGF
jgi:hypothetical protein